MIVMPMILTERLKRLALCEIAEAAAQCVCVQLNRDQPVTGLP